MNIDFTYEIHTETKPPVIAITDLNRGRTSVTNGIEEVVEYIRFKESVWPPSYLIVYRDTSGIWDGWDASKKQFIMVSRPNMMEAVTACMAALQTEKF